MGNTRRFRDPKVTETQGRIPLGRLFTRDFFSTEDEQEESAARDRNRALDHGPVFFLAAHLICTAALVFDLALSGPIPPVVAGLLAAMLALDIGLWGWVRRRPPSSLAPHVAIRGAALYALVANGLWAAIAVAAAPFAGPDSALFEIALAGAILALPIAFLSFPGLTLLGCLGCAAKVLFLSGDPFAAIASAFLALCLVHLSLRRARADASHLKRRIEIDWTAQRAARFIEEFEQAGRGWFWETTGRGAVSYVSEQLAADLKTAAEDLIGRPFGELIGADEGGESERTLGFHLSARLPFTDVTVRANTSAEISWSPTVASRNLVVAVGHADFRRAWPLPGLSRHRHRSHPAAPLRRGDQPARQI